MDQLKIGKFIAECRKEENLTQAQLAEKLNITDRAVSKWETGKAMPDTAIMIDLCKVLKITVNDLLTGERVTAENYNKELENNLLITVKEKELAYKRMLSLEVLVGVVSVLTLLALVFIGIFVAMQPWLKILIIGIGFLLFIAGCLCALRIEQVAGYYECKHCGHKYVPTYLAVNKAPHMGRKRYMKCPNCNKKSWQNKVVSK